MRGGLPCYEIHRGLQDSDDSMSITKAEVEYLPTITTVFKICGLK